MRWFRRVRIDSHKAAIKRLVDDGINAWNPLVIDEVFETEAGARAGRDFGSFKSAFPDWVMDLQELVAEDDVVVARFRCSGTHLGRWMGAEPTGRPMEVDEIFFFRFRNGLIYAMWGMEDTWSRRRQLGL